MIRKFIKIFCLILAMGMVTTMFGCSDEVEVPVIIPEKQIFADKYELNKEITNEVSYKIDYMSSNGTLFSRMEEITPLFDHIQIQVDNWPCVTVGQTTMGEIVGIVETTNDNYVTDKTNAVIAERQAIIDAEYDEAVKKAEAKGKTYDKPKKEVVTDDIHFDEPYTYTVTLGDNKKAITEEYKAMYLVDPTTYKVIYLDIAKYGIPYVRFEFMSTRQIYNNRITQESDWVMNGVKAADVSAYSTNTEGEELSTVPEFVDADGLNKAAKQNIIMSGNIAFSGDGFTWDSLMKLCNALQLNWDEDEHGFEQSSDENFTYYTIMIHANPFEFTPVYDDNGRLHVPSTRLVATFDPLTQVCLNWTVDTYTKSTSYMDKIIHDLSDPVRVNVHEYQVDTNNYPGMRESIKNWIAVKSIGAKTAYCAIDKTTNKMIGTVDTGLVNIALSPVIDGVEYQCLKYYGLENEIASGEYITSADMEAAEAIEDEGEREDYLYEKTLYLDIYCAVLDEDDEVLIQFNPEIKTVFKDDVTYYLANYEQTDAGYKDILFISADSFDALLMLYTKTYRLNEEQNAEIVNIAQQSGLMAVRDHINEMFADAEEAQKEQATQQVNKPLVAEAAKANTDVDIAVVTLNDTLFNFNNLTAKNITKSGFASTGLHLHYGDIVNMHGVKYENEDGEKIHAVEQDGKIKALISETSTVLFYNSLRVGMTVEEVDAAIGDSGIVFENGNLIMKNESNVLALVLDEDGTVVEKVYLVANDYYKTMPRQSSAEIAPIVPEQDDSAAVTEPTEVVETEPVDGDETVEEAEDIGEESDDVTKETESEQMTTEAPSIDLDDVESVG